MFVKVVTSLSLSGKWLLNKDKVVLAYQTSEQNNWYYIIFDSGNARIVFERAIEYYGDDNMDQYLYIAFARFEESQREVGYMLVVFV